FGTVVRLAQVKAASPGPQEKPAPRSAAVAVEKTKQAANGEGLLKQVQEYTWFVISVNAIANTIILQTQPSQGTSVGSGATAVSGATASRTQPGIAMTGMKVAQDAEITVNGRKKTLADVR